MAQEKKRDLLKIVSGTMRLEESNMLDPKVSVLIRLTPELAAKIRALAENDHRSFSGMVVHMLATMVDSEKA